MKSYLSVFVLLIILTACDNKRSVTPLQQTNDFIKLHIDSLDMSLQALSKAIERDSSVAQIHNNFKKARFDYKKIESVIEFYFPGISEFMAGAAIDETEEYDDKVIEATGFQVIEELLFPTIDRSAKQEILREVNILLTSMIRLRQLVETNELTDANVIEAVRLEVLRIMSLGISGFDSPVALQSIPEAKAALQGVESILSFYRDEEIDEHAFEELTGHFAAAYAYLEVNRDFDSFNRAEFITDHLNKISSAIYKYQQVLQIPNNKWLAAVDMDKHTFFEQHIFNVDFFAPTYNRDVKPQVAALGKILFFDPILSGNNSRACASCHLPSKAFSDGRKKGIAFNFRGEISRNTPSLVNSGFQRNQFWDQRVHFIEDQVTDVMANVNEMHGHINESVEKIQKSKAYTALFKEAFGGKEPVQNRNIQAALATYIRSLQGMNSRFDQYMRGDKSMLEAHEIVGFNLFMGKAKCGTCHFMPLFNGSVPPTFSETEAEVLGVPGISDTVNAPVDTDLGKFHVYHRDLHKNAFKTPTVRNAALTAPYMHNGVYQTLEEVIDFYNLGGGSGIDIELFNQTLPPQKLNLTKTEKQQIIAFIHALTDTTGITGMPASLPEFGDQKLDGRKIGGEY